MVTLRPYKYKEVTRNKDERRALPAHVCGDCVKVHVVCRVIITQYYESTPGTEADRQRAIQECSRHRYEIMVAIYGEVETWAYSPEGQQWLLGPGLP